MSLLRIKPALTLHLGGGIEMSFQLIPAGSFQMGSRGYDEREEPRHFVQITQPFYLGTFLVTQQQFAQWKTEYDAVFPSISPPIEPHFKSLRDGDPHYPASGMYWPEANQYCSWLTSNCRNQLPTGYEAGLPTEAQWEYACRAGTDTEYYTGDGAAALAEAGWYDANSDDPVPTMPVGQLKENELGLFDMHGNVEEWCADVYETYSIRVNNICDPVCDRAYLRNFRVARGGGLRAPARDCRSAFRVWRSASGPDHYQGFRVCLFLGPRPVQSEQAEQASVGVATRDEAVGPKQDRATSDFFDNFDEARFPAP